MEWVAGLAALYESAISVSAMQATRTRAASVTAIA